MSQDGGHRPVLEGIAAIGILTVMDAVIKALTDSHGTFQIAFMRYLVGSATILAIALVLRAQLPTLATLRRAVQRSIFSYGTAVLFFATLGLLPLAEALVITFTSPFFMVILARLFLREAVPPKAGLAILLGFAGVLVMLSGRLAGGGEGSLAGYATGLASSLTYAMAMVLTRRDSGHDPAIAMALSQNLVCGLMSVPLALVTFTMPSAANLPLILIVGLLGGIGNTILIGAYGRAPAARLAPLEYTSFLWAAVLGLLWFGEVPTLPTLFGAALIVAACLMVISRGRPAPAPETTV